MALKAIIENLDNVPESLKTAYVEKTGDDGSKYFQLDVEPVKGFALENVTGLKSALETERQNVKAAASKLAKFDSLDPDKAREALDKVGKMSSWTPEEKVKEQIAAQVNQVTEQFKKQLDELTGNRNKLSSQLETVLIDNAARAAIGQHKLLEGGADLLMPHIRNFVKVVDDNGNKVIKVIDPATGNPRISTSDGKVADMSVSELVAEMKTKPVYALAFEGSGASGGGAGGGKGGGSKGQFVLSSSDAKDTAKYRATREAAEKAGATVQIQD